jgi:anti-sigma B factor antagonist
MESPLQVAQREVGGIAILELSGRLIFVGGDQSLLRSEVAARIAAGATRLVVDLSQVTYIDSGGVGSLVTAYLHTVRRGGQLKVVCPNERVCRILQITHLTSVFEVFETQSAAVDSFDTQDRSDAVPS